MRGVRGDLACGEGRVRAAEGSGPCGGRGMRQGREGGRQGGRKLERLLPPPVAARRRTGGGARKGWGQPRATGGEDGRLLWLRVTGNGAGANGGACARARAASHARWKLTDLACISLLLQPTQSPYEIDLLHPLPSVEASRHKLKRLVQTPNSFFMDVKCPGCFNMYALPARRYAVIRAACCLRPSGFASPRAGKLTSLFVLCVSCSTTVFSHAQTVVTCASCNMVLCQPTGGKARLTEGCSFRKKQD